MANKKDTCTAGFKVTELVAGSQIKLPEGVTLETIESIGYGQGINFWLSPDDVIEFPKLEDARIDVESFKKDNGTLGYTLVGRVYLSSLNDWTWMPLSVLRKVPCNDYKEFLTKEQQDVFLAPHKEKTEDEIKALIEASGYNVSSDGRLYRPINEEREFFADYALGRELAARNKSDLQIYRSQAAKKLRVEKLVPLHKHEFGYNPASGKYVRLETFSGLLCYRFAEVAKK